MSNSKRIALVAMFTAIGVILNMLVFPSYTFFGTLTFVYTFCSLAGVFLGPWLGGISAGMADIIGYLLNPQGPFIPQIAIANALMAVVAGLCYRLIKFKKREYTLIIASLISYVFLSVGLTSWGLSMFYFKFFKTAQVIGAKLNINSPFVMTALFRAITQPLWIIINLIFSMIVTSRLKVKEFRPEKIN